MHVGFDGGYNGVKVIGSTNGGDVRRVWFPSVAGTADVSRFGLEDGYRDGGLIEVDDRPWFYGAPAVDLSRFENRREDRFWWKGEAYRILFLAALANVTAATSVDVNLVTGLPLRYYGDREAFRELLAGEHALKHNGGHEQRFRVSTPRVIGQPFGTFLSHALSDDGTTTDEWLGRFGVIDIGGHTTNILSVLELREVRRESVSIDVGGWLLASRVNEFLGARCPGLEPRDHEIARAIVNGYIRYGGERVDLTSNITAYSTDLAATIISEATQAWNGGMHLENIYITGGGAHLIGPALLAQFPHAEIVDDPVFANALGYWKFARRSS